MDVEADDGVDIGVLQLHDYLSDRPAMPPLVDVKEGPNATCSSAATVVDLAEGQGGVPFYLE